MTRGPLIKMALGQGNFRGRIVISGDSVEAGSAEDRLQRLNLLQAFANQPDLQAVAGHDFESMKMTFSGSRWIIELEADL